MKKKFWGIFIATLSSASIITYLYWRVVFTIPSDVNQISLIFAILLLIFEFICALELLIYYRQIISIHQPKKPKHSTQDLPDVDVFIATLNDPIDVLQTTATACKNMLYPHPRKIHIYICDDGCRAAVAKLAKKLKINYIERKDRAGAKAGNLNHALAKTKSPLIALFDADMIPSKEFLMETVPYFIGKNNSQIGFVQTPQMFYEPDLFQFNLYAEETMPNEHEYFYRVVQPSKNKSNSVIFCGTNAVVSRRSLEEIGGFAVRSITEDFATGVEIQSKGYRCLAISAPLASGLPPHNLRNLIRQRIRWARGNIQAGRRQNILFRKGFSLWQRINYLNAVTSWLFPIKQLIFLAAPILFSTFSIVFVKCTLADIFIFWLPMYLLTNFSIWYFSKRMRKTKWTRTYETIFTPALFLPVLMEIFGLTYDNFVVTEKKRRGADQDTIMYKATYSVPFVLFLALTGFGIYQTIISITAGAVNHYIVLFWLLLNVYYLGTALRFIFSDRRPETIVSPNTAPKTISQIVTAPKLKPEKPTKPTPKTTQPSQKKPLPIRRLTAIVTTLALLTLGIVFRHQIIDYLFPDNRMPIATLHRGINLGNALDAPPNEDWGLEVKNAYFDIIAAAGFDFVRLPVRFQDYLDETGALAEPFMQTIDDHIDYALNAGLTLILDFHHFDELMITPDQYSGQFLSIWGQLAERYADYPNQLVFELLNEPSKLLHAGRWNPLAAEALSIVRATNPDRTVIIGSTNMYSVFDLKLLDFPADDRLIIAFNYYLPNQFTFQGDPWHPGYEEMSGNEWGSDEDYELLEARFAAAAKLAEERNWRLALNEFGVTKSVPDDQRSAWIAAVRKAAEANHISWAYWEFATSFGLYDLEAAAWNQKLLETLFN